MYSSDRFDPQKHLDKQCILMTKMYRLSNN